MDTNTPETYNKHFLTEPSRWAGDPDKVDVAFIGLLKELGMNDGSKIIDMGCGQGRTMVALRKHHKGIIYGVDWSIEGLNIAKRSADKHMVFIVGDISKLNGVDVPDKQMDYAISVGTHEHLEKPDFKECFRVLKDTGIFIACIPCSDKGGWVKYGPQWGWRKSIEYWKSIIERDGFSCEYSNIPIRFSDFFICRKYNLRFMGDES